MSSDQEVNFVAPARVSNKLTLDSQQQERKEQEQRQRIEQIQKRKDQKRKKRQQAEQAELQKQKLEEEKQKKYDLPEMMFEEDSEDGVQFRRVVKKIKKLYPEYTNKFQTQTSKKKNDFIVNDFDEDESDQSDSGSDSGSDAKSQSRHKKPIKQKKIEKQKRPEKRSVEKKKVDLPPVKKQKVKIEHKSDKKQNLVREVSVRWWYALPDWPPADFDYEAKLKNLGYRVLDAQKFKLQQDIVNGLQKVVAVDGYKGVYKSKTKLIDVRPKQSAPTLNNFRSMSIEQLTDILRKALSVQIDQLKQVKYKQKGQDELLTQLQRELIKLR